MTQGEILAAFVDRMHRAGQTEHSSVTLKTNARRVQIDVTVRTGGLPTWRPSTTRLRSVGPYSTRCERSPLERSRQEPGRMVTGLLIAGVVWIASARAHARRHWRRLLLGAFVGWALASVVGACALVAIELETGHEVPAAGPIAFVYAGIAAGAVTAYKARRADGQA
jgi:hypothetical protein